VFILGWAPRGLATASATALLGPRPDSSMLWRGPSQRCPSWGQYLHGRIVKVIIIHLEWGSSSSSNTRRSGRSQTSNTFKLIKCRTWVQQGPRSPLFWFMLSLELEAPRLAYGYAPVAAGTSVDLPRHEFFKFVPARWRQGELLHRNYQRRRSSLASISPLHRSLKRRKLDKRSGRR
jgi:hypothetical protein